MKSRQDNFSGGECETSILEDYQNNEKNFLT
jgi:hypothetical protein